MLHVLPKGFKRIRHYGLIGPAHKAANLAAPAPDPVLVESVAAFMRRVAGIEGLNCPHCREGRFVVIEAIPPSPLPRPPPKGRHEAFCCLGQLDPAAWLLRTPGRRSSVQVEWCFYASLRVELLCRSAR
ncbi:MAG: hypothetical protein ABIU05_11445 [Nitrospirales bacterium]